MEDTRTLFHTPDQLSDADLSVMRNKLRQQRLLPFVSAAVGGVAVVGLQSAVLRRPVQQSVVALGALAGYTGGAYQTNYFSCRLNKQYNMPVLNARDQRYVKIASNKMGQGSEGIDPMIQRAGFNKIF